MSPKNPDAAALYDHGLRALGRFFMQFEDADLARASNAFRRASEVHPTEARYWVALGYTLDAQDAAEDALAAMRRAHALDPADEEPEVFILTLLSELGREDEALAGIEALASRTDFDLDALRREIEAADMPVDARTLLYNGFLRARNFVRSRLSDAIDRAERRGGSADLELQDCLERQADLQGEIDAEQMPPELRPLFPWVSRLGVGDDPCRSLLAQQLTQDERGEAQKALGSLAATAHAWLDTYGANPMPPEAAALMYTLLAMEELGPDG